MTGASNPVLADASFVRQHPGCAGCLTVIGVVVVALVTCVYIILHSWNAPPMPHVDKIAFSPGVTAADQTATRELGEDLARIRDATPWIAETGRSTDDLCATREFVGAFGARPIWMPVSCGRTLGWFGGFNGDFPPQLTRVNKALVQLGWMPSGTPIDQLFRIDQARAATASPSTPSLTIADGLYEKGKQYLRVEMTKLPLAPFSDIGLGDPAATTPGQGVHNPPGTVHRELRPVSLTALADQAGHSSRYMIGIEIHTNYYATPSPRTSAGS